MEKNKMEKQEKGLESQWESELVRRIADIGQYPDEIKSMNRKDYIAAGIIIMFCLFAVVAGAFI